MQFCAFNVATGKLADLNGYPDADQMPGIELTPFDQGVSGVTSSLASFAYQLDLPIPMALQLDSAEQRHRAVYVPEQDGTLRLDQLAALPTVAQAGRGVVVVAGATTSKKDSPYSVLAAPAPAEVDAHQGADAAGADTTGGTAAASPAAGDGGCQSAPSGSAGGMWVLLLGALAALRRRWHRAA